MTGRVETALVVGAPLLLAILEIFHPHPHDLFRLDLRAWMAVHYLQIVLFPLAALALMRLVRGRPGFAAGLCRVAAFVFGVTWIAFDSVAGVATGILLQAAQAGGSPEAWRAPGDDNLGSPDRRRGRDAEFGAAAAGGRRVCGMGLGSLAAAYTLRRAGGSWSVRPYPRARA
jgi:hypothetical protein